jgi:hypothetical protein
LPTISYRLHYGQSQIPVLEIIPDPTGLYRIAWPDILVCGFGKPYSLQAGHTGMGAASARCQGPQFVSGLAFEIIQELFMASLVQRFKSLGGT